MIEIISVDVNIFKDDVPDIDDVTNMYSKEKGLQCCSKYRILARGINAKALIHIDGKRLIENKGDYARDSKQENDWNGGLIMSTKSILSFQYCESNKMEKKVIDEKLDFHILQFRLINLKRKARDNISGANFSSILSNPHQNCSKSNEVKYMKCANASNNHSNHKCIATSKPCEKSINDMKENKSNFHPSLNIEVKSNINAFNEITEYCKHDKKLFAGHDECNEIKINMKKKKGSMHLATNSNKLKTYHSENDRIQDISKLKTVHDSETEMKKLNLSQGFDQIQQQHKSGYIDSCQEIETEKIKNIISKESDSMKSPCQKKKISTVPIKKVSIHPSTSHIIDQSYPTSKTNNKYIILLLQIGRTMPKSRFRILTNALLLKKNVQIANSVHHDPPPTHIVIDEHVSAASVSKYLGFQSPEEMNLYLIKFKIMTVKPDWVIRFNNGIFNFTIDHIWPGLSNFESSNLTMQSLPTKRKKNEKLSKENGWIEISRGDAFAPIKYVKASQVSKNNVISRVAQLRAIKTDFQANKLYDSKKNSVPQIQQSPDNSSRNKELSKLFSELAQVHKNSPLDDIDEWRYYMFTVISGRVKKLDFEIVYNEEVFKNLKKIKGFGNSVISKIKEFLLTGKCKRLEELRKDPLRIAMKNMMNIWGVGKSKASELVRLGYRTIDDIRNDLLKGQIILTRNAKIGVQCYEDFMEQISRNEVEAIGNIVINKCKELLPLSEVSIMGSFRRGHKSSGDVDILITHAEYNDSPPCGKLGQVVNALFSEGHLIHHLNKVEGMNINDMNTEVWATTLHCEKEDIPDTFSSSSSRRDSYMGVFASPTTPGKMRRIDIKFYPYKERAFATLYFTGNGFFNRSMRLWATKEKCMILSDHGLYPFNDASKGSLKHQHTMTSLEAVTERDIFTLLGLQYRKPEERDTFDSVVKYDGQVVDLESVHINPLINSFEEE